MPEETGSRPFVSVIIPTFNRSRMLRDTVETFVRQSLGDDRFEIVIVDNASTDDTPDVIAELCRESKNVRALTESRRGAHFARNTGALSARGDVLYFTDDDMLAAADLLVRIIEPFAAGANVGSATGRVIPRWETEPPAWVLEHCRNELLSLNDRGQATIIGEDDPGIFSCHQAVLREAFMQAGGFNPDTNAGEFVGDNETGLNIKIASLGYRFAYVGAAVIEHVIPAARMTQRYLNSRFADQGLCDSYTLYRSAQPGAMGLALSIARNAAKVLPSAMLAAARRIAGRSAWHLNLARVYYLRNRVRYDARLLRSDEWRRFALRDNWLVND